MPNEVDSHPHRDSQHRNSWNSWGSPIGLGLFILLVALANGLTIWLIHLAK